MWNMCGQTLATAYITLEWWAACSAHNDSKSGLRIIDRDVDKILVCSNVEKIAENCLPLGNLCWNFKTIYGG
jgi:hypothetical protein